MSNRCRWEASSHWIPAPTCKPALGSPSCPTPSTTSITIPIASSSLWTPTIGSSTCTARKSTWTARPPTSPPARNTKKLGKGDETIHKPALGQGRQTQGRCLQPPGVPQMGLDGVPWMPTSPVPRWSDPISKEFAVREATDVRAFDEVLHGVKKDRLAQLIRFGAVRVNDQPVLRATQALQPDTVAIDFDGSLLQDPGDINVVYQDAPDMVVIDKPSRAAHHCHRKGAGPNRPRPAEPVAGRHRGTGVDRGPPGPGHVRPHSCLPALNASSTICRRPGAASPSNTWPWWKAPGLEPSAPFAVSCGKPRTAH